MGLMSFLMGRSLPEVTCEELAGGLGGAQAPLVLDVRSPEEFAAGHVPGAMNIPHDQLSRRHAELATHRGRPVVVCCRSGMRAGMAAKVLHHEGFTDVRMLSGHMQAWCAAGRPLTKGA